MQVWGYISIIKKFRVGKKKNPSKIRHLLVNAYSSYNIMIGPLRSNVLETIISIFNLTIKYLLDNRHKWVMK